MTSSKHTSSVTSMTINKGTCYAVFAYDIGWSIDLEDVSRRLRLTGSAAVSGIRRDLRNISNTGRRRYALCKKEEASQSARIDPVLRSKSWCMTSAP